MGHVKLAAARSKRVHIYFNAKDRAATAHKWSVTFKARWNSATSFASAMHAEHERSKKHTAAMNDKREAAFKDWIVSRKAHRAARSARHAAMAAWVHATKARHAAVAAHHHAIKVRVSAVSARK